jgi:hypothetical protein
MKRRIIFQLIYLLTTPLTITQVHAQTWAATHPYRASDNARLSNQNARITRGVQNGQISQAQAHQLRANDHAIRTEERADASVNGSHLTPQEQQQITAQQNANSNAIFNAKH